MTDINVPIKKVDDTFFEGKIEPTQYDYETNSILVKSSYDVETDPEGWIVHELMRHKLKDVKDDGKNITIERESYVAQFKTLRERGHSLDDIMDVNKFPTLSLKFEKFKNEEYGTTLRTYWIISKIYFDEEDALKFLLDGRYVFVNYRKYQCPSEEKLIGPTMVIYVNCNDTFGYACADAEDIGTETELEKLYNYVSVNPWWGSTSWVIEKRKQKPIQPVIDRMKKLCIWKPEYDSY